MNHLASEKELLFIRSGVGKITPVSLRVPKNNFCKFDACFGGNHQKNDKNPASQKGV
jgi:hypothetical protein